MAALCLGSYGLPGYKYSRHASDMSGSHTSDETVWVTKRYIPDDLRVTAPVPRCKPVVPDPSSLPTPQSQWVQSVPCSPYTHSRHLQEKEIHYSHPSTRCEEWSTLRQMLPSSGRPTRRRPFNWGTGLTAPPTITSEASWRFPHINSPMTRYVDDMHLTNRLFKLH